MSLAICNAILWYKYQKGKNALFGTVNTWNGNLVKKARLTLQQEGKHVALSVLKSTESLSQGMHAWQLAIGEQPCVEHGKTTKRVASGSPFDKILII